jgi:hypothetical protein
MGKLLKWLEKSNRYKHIVCGCLIGLFADNLYCAAYAGLGIASALEFKDKSWGGEWDWIDWICTIIGVAAGFGIRILIIKNW